LNFRRTDSPRCLVDLAINAHKRTAEKLKRRGLYLTHSEGMLKGGRHKPLPIARGELPTKVCSRKPFVKPQSDCRDAAKGKTPGQQFDEPRRRGEVGCDRGRTGDRFVLVDTAKKATCSTFGKTQARALCWPPISSGNRLRVLRTQTWSIQPSTVFKFSQASNRPPNLEPALPARKRTLFAVRVFYGDRSCRQRAPGSG